MKFIDYIDKNNIDTVLNLGDFLQKGPNPCEVVDKILSDKRFINISGNNERKLISTYRGQILNSKNKEHQNWTIGMLGSTRMENIIKVEAEKVLEIEGLKMLMLHTRRKHISDFPLIYSKNSADDFVNDYSDYNVNVVLFGHTHQPLYLKWSNMVFINPGTLGCSKKSEADFVIMEIENGEILDCSYKSLKYDNSKVIEDYIKFNVPDKELLMKIFHGKEI
ncbi:phosphodiesterase [compost metagenome]